MAQLASKHAKAPIPNLSSGMSAIKKTGGGGWSSIAPSAAQSQNNSAVEASFPHQAAPAASEEGSVSAKKEGGWTAISSQAPNAPVPKKGGWTAISSTPVTDVHSK